MASNEASIRIRALIGAALLAAVAAVYAPVATHDFINFDDPLWITDNAAVQEGLSRESVVWALTATDDGNWIPLTWLSHMLAVELFGLDPGAHLIINAAIHAATALLLFFLLARMTGQTWLAAAVAALFALHPLRVESVAWVSERKDVLAGFFWMLTIAAYLRYTRQPSVSRYTVALAVFFLGLLCKPMLVTLPFVLLLLDYWPLQRWRPGDTEGDSKRFAASLPIVEKLPMLLVAAAIASVTFISQRDVGSMGNPAATPLGHQLMNAAAAYAIYLGQTVWPFSLAVFYPPHPEPVLLRYGILGGLLLFTGCATSVAVARSRPHLIVGFLWFVGTLVPVIGLVQVGQQAHADRYTYIPHVGLFIALVWFVAGFARTWPRLRTPFIALTAVLLIGLSLRTSAQLAHWKNSRTLFAHALEVTRENAVAHGSYGQTFLRARDFEGAAHHFREAIRIRPGNFGDYHNLGMALSAQGKNIEAKTRFREALVLKADDAYARYKLGYILLHEENAPAAAEAFSKLVEVHPEHVDGRINLAIALAQQEKFAMAEPHFLKALELEPKNATAHYNYALLLIKTLRPTEAEKHLRTVLEHEPDHTQAGDYLAILARERSILDSADRSN